MKINWDNKCKMFRMVNVHSNHSTNNTKVYVISLGTSKEEKSHIE